MTQHRTLVVVPAFNEENSVGEVVSRILDVGLPVLVVDDGSADMTAELARAAGAAVVCLPINIGVGGARRTGFRYAVDRGYHRVVQVDADLQHPPEAIAGLLEVADQGHDLVIGSRFARGYETGKHRRLAMKVLASWVSHRTKTNLDDVTSGFLVVTDPLLSVFAEHYPAEYLGDTVEAILQAHAFGASIAQVPVPMEARESGDATSSLAAGGHLARLTVSIIAGKPERMGR
jgi:glycosyltransferase involved in cell wall biosynthesis